MRTVVIGLGCLCAALLSGCGGSGNPAVPPATQTVTVTPPSPSEPAPTYTGTSTSTRAKVFDQTAVQESVKKILTDSYKVEGIKTVSCPADQEVKVGGTFDCAVALGDVVKKVTLTITSDTGDYEVGTLG
ncbi:MAG: hypothetical protein QOI21_2621 [Actinomycetota bacterium]|jgi:hypothetical protein|nr:hypothetical protein [Actinomycetota bacterium]